MQGTGYLGRNNSLFTDGKYRRVHNWTFDGGTVVSASSSPHVFKVPYLDPTCVDPQKAFRCKSRSSKVGVIHRFGHDLEVV